MAERERTWKWWIAFAAVAAFAFALTAFAYAGQLPGQFFERDKPVHFAIAGLLAFCLDRATGARSLKWILALLVVLAIEEYTQRFSVHRSSSFLDYAADVAGVACLTALSRVLSKPARAKSADDVAE